MKEQELCSMPVIFFMNLCISDTVQFMFHIQQFSASYEFTEKGFLTAGESFMHAAPLARHTKVFTRRNTDGYMLGEPADYIAVRSDDFGDVYVIKRRIFDMTYEIFS